MIIEQLMIIKITIRRDLRRIPKVLIPHYNMQMRFLRISRAKAVTTNQRASQRAQGNEPIRGHAWESGGIEQSGRSENPTLTNVARSE